MKTKKIELDVDFIGSQPSKVTMDEERAISEYISSHKTKLIQKTKKHKMNV